MYEIKQLSIFLENKPGPFLTIAESLAEGNMNLRGICVTDAGETGVLRLIVDQPEAGVQQLKAQGISSQISHILVVQLEDRPGMLATVLKSFGEAQLNIEYLYGFRNQGAYACLALKVQDTDKAVEVLKEKNIRLLTEQELFQV